MLSLPQAASLNPPIRSSYPSRAGFAFVYIRATTEPARPGYNAGMNRVLVIGATGRVGRQVVNRLSSNFQNPRSRP
jgi:hypothetical protein